MNMATRLAAAGSRVGLSQAQILGFATALSSVGLEAQAGGTAFSKAVIQMQVAVETGNASLKDFARVAGVTTEEFKALWQSDPAGAIEKFIVGLAQMDEQGVSSIVTLQEMGFTEVRLRDTLMRATNATGLFSDAQQTATSAWQENVALSNEVGKRYATMTSAQARWNEFAQNPGAITTEAIITGYGQQDGVEPPKLETVITISGYDLTAYRQFMADNPIEVEGVLRLSEVFSNEANG